jgi:hypothetical protein
MHAYKDDGGGDELGVGRVYRVHTYIYIYIYIICTENGSRPKKLHTDCVSCKQTFDNVIKSYYTPPVLIATTTTTTATAIYSPPIAHVHLPFPPLHERVPAHSRSAYRQTVRHDGDKRFTKR